MQHRSLFFVILIVLFCNFLVISSLAQENQVKNQSKSLSEGGDEKSKSFTLSGYMQAQYQYGDSDAVLGVGTPNENSNNSYSRIGIRRGRLKFGYAKEWTTAVFQIDITEKGFGVKDAYMSFNIQSLGQSKAKFGIFDRPFGFEVINSSSRRESPEVSYIISALFPDSRDVGGMLSLQMPKSSALSIIRLDAGLFAGNGIKPETDSRLDFIGRLGFSPKMNGITLGGGVSCYLGSVYQGTSRVFTMKDDGFVVDDNPSNMGKYAQRRYFGVDLQLEFNSGIGPTRLLTEYIGGKQPGTAVSSLSPNSAQLPKSDTYIRNFAGGYLMLVQGIAQSPLSLIVKYDFYDPNTDVSGDKAGLKGTSITDLMRSTIGTGLVYHLNSDVRLTCYYDFKRNETSGNIASMHNDLDDNVFTLRIQYKF